MENVSEKFLLNDLQYQPRHDSMSTVSSDSDKLYKNIAANIANNISNLMKHKNISIVYDNVSVSSSATNVVHMTTRQRQQENITNNNDYYEFDASATNARLMRNESLLRRKVSNLSANLPCNKDTLKQQTSMLSAQSSNINSRHTLMNFSNIVDCLKSFHVTSGDGAYLLLLNTLKNYTLGPKDDLKCGLCLIEKFNLDGFAANHAPKPLQLDNMSDVQKSMVNLLSAKRPRSCNPEKLKRVAKYINAFNPFCNEYCDKFYPNCNDDIKNADGSCKKNVRFIPRKNKCNDGASSGWNTAKSEGGATLTPTASSRPTLGVNNNNNDMSNCSQLKNLLHNQSNMFSMQQQSSPFNSNFNSITNTSINSLVDCLKDFSLPHQNKNTGQKQTEKAEKIQSMLKFKPLPITHDRMGNLVVKVNIPDKLATKMNQVSKCILNKK